MNPLLQRTEDFARETVRMRFPAGLCFHNAAHFAQVAAYADQLARAAALSEEEAAALHIAAWSHDLGYADGMADHELRSADLIAGFLAQEGAPAALIATVRRLILATRRDADPADPLEALMKDADLGHLAAADYPERLALLREERRIATGRKVPKAEWLDENVSFLEHTLFRSDTARTLWDAGRLRNLNALKAMQNDPNTPAVPDPEKRAKKEAKKAKKAQREKIRETERGVETMFRVTLNNHTRLSQIADNKANIMLTVNALMISYTLGGPMTKVDKHPEFLLPLGLVLLTSAVCIITATLATRPSVTHGRTTREEIKRREANLLFFGNFHDMPLDEYQAGMRDLMEDRDYLYGTLTKDLHSLGKVLHRKYRFLRITYTIFMLGVVSTVALVLYMASRGIDWLLM